MTSEGFGNLCPSVLFAVSISGIGSRRTASRLMTPLLTTNEHSPNYRSCFSQSRLRNSVGCERGMCTEAAAAIKRHPSWYLRVENCSRQTDKTEQSSAHLKLTKLCLPGLRSFSQPWQVESQRARLQASHLAIGMQGAFIQRLQNEPSRCIDVKASNMLSLELQYRGAQAQIDEIQAGYVSLKARSTCLFGTAQKAN